MPYIYFYTLGCKLNFTETSTLKRIAKENNFDVTIDVTQADVIVVNTCTVTQMADKKSRYAIRHVQSKNPNARIMVTGCYADTDAESLKQISGISSIFGNAEKNYFREWLSSSPISEKKHTSSFFNAYSLGDRTRSFLKVQDGCNYFCSYCKVPYARGKSRNASIRELVNEVHEIETHGIKEIVLTGINIGDYGHSTSETFFKLIQTLEQETSIERFRISSIEPNLLTDEIIDFVLSSKRFVPHFHIPLQSGSDEILSAMHRRYSAQLFADKINYIIKKNKETGIGIDVIVGFPGETEALFNETMELLTVLPFSYLHVFEFSERKGTPAAQLPNKVKDSIKKQRSEQLHKLSQEKHLLFAEQNIGKIRNVLIERKSKEQRLSGFTDNYIKVSLPYQPETINKIIPITLIKWDEDSKTMIGEI